MKHKIIAKRTIIYEGEIEAEDKIEAREKLKALNKAERLGDNCDLRDLVYDGNISSDTMFGLMDD